MDNQDGHLDRDEHRALCILYKEDELWKIDVRSAPMVTHSRCVLSEVLSAFGA